MFDVKKLPATPAMARRLLAFCQHFALDIDPQLYELAGEDLIDEQLIKLYPNKLSGQSILALQHVRDWNGRAMLLDDGFVHSRAVALANAWINGGKTLIVTSAENFGDWSVEARKVWPDAHISIFGNPRYTSPTTKFASGCTFEANADFTADVLITSYSGLITQDVLEHVTISQTIVDELDCTEALNYKWEEAVIAAFHEMPRPLMIQNTNRLPNTYGMTNIATLNVHRSQGVDFILSNVTRFLWSGIQLPSMFASWSFDEIEKYHQDHITAPVSILEYFELFGVSSHLLNMDKLDEPLTFSDVRVKTSLNQPKHHGNLNAGLHRIVNREDDLALAEGKTIDQLVQNALSDHLPSQTLLGALMTPQWSNVKAEFTRTIYSSIATRSNKVLFLAENMNIRRSLMLQFTNQITIFDPKSSDEILERFQISTNVSRLNTLIVTMDDLINYPELLDHAQMLFMVQPILSKEMYEGMVEACKLSSTRLIKLIMNGTFDEKVFKQLQ